MKNLVWVSLLLLFIFLVLLIIIVKENEQTQLINQLPKKVCHTEYKIHKIITDCGGIPQYIPANAERICEEGIEGGTEILDYTQIVYDCNFDGIERVCLYKEKVEICNIV